MSPDETPTAAEPMFPVVPEAIRFLRGLLHPDSIVFNLTVAAVAGAVTTVFVAVIGIMLLVATNFNLLGAIE